VRSIDREQLKQELKLMFFYVIFNLILLPACISLHEWGHWFAAALLGYRQGYVTYCWSGGIFHLAEPIRNTLDSALIGVAGGLTVGVIFSAFYFCLDWETDMVEKYVLRNYIVSQLIYAYVEMLYGLGIVDLNLLVIVSNIVYPICLYTSLIYLYIHLHKKADY